MRALSLTILVACSSLASVARAQATASPEQERAKAREVLVGSQALDRALKQRDTATVAKFYSNGFLQIDQFGVRSTKEQRLAELGSIDRKGEAIGVVDEVRASAFNDVIVVTSRTRQQHTLNGKAVGDGPTLSTRVWIRQAGRWQVILTQVTPIAAH